MTVRRSRMFGGEIYLKNRQRRERIRKAMKKIKDIREEKNTLLRQATIRYNNREK